MASASVELQTVIYQRLVADAAIHALVADRIFDRRPDPSVGSTDFPCITFGPSDYVTDDADCITGRTETIQLDCWARAGGKLRPAREIADAVKKSLHGYEADLATNALVEMRVELVRAFADPDGLTAHGVVQVRCLVEEA